jgi:hypothetical protein
MSKWVYLIKLDSASRNLRNLHYMYKKVVIITYPQFVAKFQTSKTFLYYSIILSELNFPPLHEMM